MLLVDIDENQTRERPLIEALAQRVDGLLVSSRLPDEYAHWMLDLGKPVVVRNAELPIPSVGINSRLATYMLARHLLDLGHDASPISVSSMRASTTNAFEARATVSPKRDSNSTSTKRTPPTSVAGEHACSRVMLEPRRPRKPSSATTT